MSSAIRLLNERKKERNGGRERRRGGRPGRGGKGGKKGEGGRERQREGGRGRNDILKTENLTLCSANSTQYTYTINMNYHYTLR